MLLEPAQQAALPVLVECFSAAAAAGAVVAVAGGFDGPVRPLFSGKFSKCVCVLSVPWS